MSGTNATTVDDVVSDIIREMSQVPGQATQIYATPRMQQHVQDAVQLEIEEMWWPMLMCYLQVAVDPINGLPVADLKGPISYIDDYHDIAGVYPSDSNRRMPELPQSVNPFLLTGGMPSFISADGSTAHRPFRVWPASSGTVVVRARQRPTLPMAATDRVYLDRLLLTYDACWMYAVDDGTIPAQVNKFQVLATNRRRRMKAAYNSQPLMLDPRYGSDEMIDDGSIDTFTLDRSALG